MKIYKIKKNIVNIHIDQDKIIIIIKINNIIWLLKKIIIKLVKIKKNKLNKIKL